MTNSHAHKRCRHFALVSTRARGQSPGLALAALSLVLVAGLFWLALWMRPDARRTSDPSLEVRIYCAAGLAKAVEAALSEYRDTYAINAYIARTGGSGKLFGQLCTEVETGVRQGADLYITSESDLLIQGHSRGVIAERIPMARQLPVIAAPAGKALEIHSLPELIAASPSLRYGIAHEGAAIGRLVREIAQADHIREELLQNCKMEVENVMQLAQALESRALDAAVVWDATVKQVNRQREQPILQTVAALGPAERFAGEIAVGVVTNTAHPTAALRVARFLTAHDGGLPHLARDGFQVVDGDVWDETPDIHLFCGSMFTPVFEETVRSFASREGVNIYPKWAGCGNLVATIKSTTDPQLMPDAFLSCDRQFLEQVNERFADARIISSNDLVLAVRHEHAGQLSSPRDLLKPRIRFGLADPDQSALGALTRRLFTERPYEDLYGQLQPLAAVVADTGPSLLSQLLAGGLDAAVVYRSNVMADLDNLSQLSILDIDDGGRGNTRAIQPWAVGRDSPHRQLMSRLFAALTSAESRSRFDAAGFRWLGGTPAESAGQ